ncbi:MAG: hypothetical protein Q8L14_15505, partial [Myxococcales bacterium]|nr:hypothetical protein [Myxococcales bacterium]
MLPLLLLSFVGAGPFDLPAAAAEVPIPSHHPALAGAGATTVLIWEDGRPEALLSPVERTPTPLPQFWWTRVQPDGGSQPRTGQPGCLGGEGSQFVVTANPISGVAYVGWLVRRSVSAAALQVGVLEQSGTLICNANTSGQLTVWPSDLLSLGWTGSQFFAGWRNTTSAQQAWCSAMGVCGTSMTIAGVRPSPDVSFGAGAQPGTAEFRGVGTGSPWFKRSPEGSFGGVFGMEAWTADQVVVDPFALSTGFREGNADWQVVTPGGQKSTGTTRPIQLVSLAQSNTTIVVLESGTAAALTIWPDGGTHTTALGQVSESALTSDGVSARLAWNSGGAVATRIIGADGGVSTPIAAAMARPPQRAPSIAWVFDRWLIVFEEWNGTTWMPRGIAFTAGGSIISQTGMGLPGSAPSLVTAPDGGVFLSSTSAGSAVLHQVTGASPLAITMAGSLGPGASGGAVTNAGPLWWTSRGPYVNGVETPTLDAGVLATTGAVVPGGIWIPQRPAVSTNGVTARFVSDPPVSFSTTVTIPIPADRSAPLASASVETPDGWRWLLAWFDTAAISALNVRTFRADGGPLGIDVLQLTGTNRGLAATGTVDQDFAVVTSDGTEVKLHRVDPATGTIVTSERVNSFTSTELTGDPVVAAAPTGQLAIAWPALDPMIKSTVIRFVLVGNGGMEPDAGAGGGAAGGGAAGGG